jgi:hypothetical protein
MEAEILLSCFQDSAINPYLAQDESSAQSHIVFLRSVLVLYSHLCLPLPSGFFVQDFSTEIVYGCLFSHAFYMLHTSHPPCYG